LPVQVTRTAPRLAAVTHFFVAHGLPLLFVVVMLESFGLPLPGETALITFGVLAAQGHYSIVWVIVLAAAGAIIGDNLGYWLLGRLGGRALFRRWGWLRRYSDRILPRAERIMRRHGGKTVFFGRFVAVLRVSAAAVAGLAHMQWWKFLFWNASGGIVWAGAFGLASFYGGKAVGDAIQRYGLYAAGVLVVVLVVGAFALRRVKRQVEDSL
jgi:membrane protein DedA with SNARE-associated domain